jgi:hypothetical protein
VEREKKILELINIDFKSYEMWKYNIKK